MQLHVLTGFSTENEWEYTRCFAQPTSRDKTGGYTLRTRLTRTSTAPAHQPRPLRKHRLLEFIGNIQQIWATIHNVASQRYYCVKFCQCHHCSLPRHIVTRSWREYVLANNLETWVYPKIKNTGCAAGCAAECANLKQRINELKNASFSPLDEGRKVQRLSRLCDKFKFASFGRAKYVPFNLWNYLSSSGVSRSNGRTSWNTNATLEAPLRLSAQEGRWIDLNRCTLLMASSQFAGLTPTATKVATPASKPTGPKTSCAEQVRAPSGAFLIASLAHVWRSGNNLYGPSLITNLICKTNTALPELFDSKYRTKIATAHGLFLSMM